VVEFRNPLVKPKHTSDEQKKSADAILGRIMINAIKSWGAVMASIVVAPGPILPVPSFTFLTITLQRINLLKSLKKVFFEVKKSAFATLCPFASCVKDGKVLDSNKNPGFQVFGAIWGFLPLKKRSCF
jgi:hypothetical protein